MSIETAVRRYCRLEKDQVVLAAQPYSIRSYEKAVVFVLATWSGQALAALRELAEILAAESHAAPHLVVFDADRITEALVEELGARPQGRGEAFWVKSGFVVGSILRWDIPTLRDEVIGNNSRLRDPE